MEEDLILAKAILASGGAVQIPEGYRIPVRISRSTTGPGAGSRSVVFSFGGMRVKKAISTESGEFVFDPEKRTLSKDGGIIADGVSIIPVAFHCPEQAFFNLEQRCKFDCLFCSSPLLERDATKGLDADRIVSMIKESKDTVESVALTSGVKDSVEATVDRMAECVSRLHKEFPDRPIGVEPYVDDTEQIDILHEAGASEIKINLETATDELFKVFCPSLDRFNIFNMLAHAVKVFGKGKVSSNIIIGLGETDEDVIGIVERLCSMGVTPTIRGLRVGKHTSDILAENHAKPPSPQRMIDIAKMVKQKLTDHDLDTRTFDTMCLRCTCCDLVPFIDL